MNTEIAQADFLTPELAETLNRRCHCVSVDMTALRAAVEKDCAAERKLLHERPHLFAAPPVFLARSQVSAMQDAVSAIESVITMPAFRERVLAESPEIARFDPSTRGVFLGYDFHLTPEGPKLIEINTNAGGAMLNAALLRAARACCEEVETLSPGARSVNELPAQFLAMFEQEWQLQRGSDAKLRSIAIVDENPTEQYLYPEFLLFQDLFNRGGIRAIVADPSELTYENGRLKFGELEIDLVYNRLTDFDLSETGNLALREAYLNNDVMLTPHPRAHALHADKRNLVLLSDPDWLASIGVDEATISILANSLPRTETVTPDKAERLWAERKKLFFKPMSGFGSRGAYRGDKITKRVWEEILAGNYIAQALMPPSERVIGDAKAPIALKADFRNYVYNGQVQLLAARLYQGQTTNFRTPGGGFAPVFSRKIENCRHRQESA